MILNQFQKKKKKSIIYIKLLNPIKVILSFSFFRDGFVGHSNSDFVGILLEVVDRIPLCLNALILEHPFLLELLFAIRIKSPLLFGTDILLVEYNFHEQS
ncbi:hypothetical protein ACTFIT_007107 [Dictyostelium discoideum]